MNQNLISLEQWAAFVAVVEEGSYAKAAEALNKSQSTVSYAVSRVEESLGAPVLKVSGRKAQLTPLGEVMLRRAQQLIKDAKETEQLARCVAQGWESEVSIAVDVIFPMSKVLDALEAFNQQGKPTRIRVLETSLSGTDEVLLNGQANLVISPRFPPGFIGEQFASIEFLAVAHKDHPLNLLDTSFNVDELAPHRQVVMRDSGVKRNQNAGWLGAEQRITVSHFSTSVEVIKRGLAFGWVPTSYMQRELSSGELKELNLVEGRRRAMQLYLINPKGELAGPATQLLRQIFLEQKE